MPNTKKQILIVGADSNEQEQLKSWLKAQDCGVWFAEGARGAMRVAQDIRPSIIVVDTLLPDAEPKRLVRVLKTAFPDKRMLFLLNHEFEAGYYSNLARSLDTELLHRPINPRDILTSQADPPAALDGVPLHGDIDPWDLMDVIFALFRHKKSGLLAVEHHRTRKLLYFLDGLPVHVESNIVDESTCHILMREGHISAPEFEWSRNLGVNEGIRQAEALVKIGVMDAVELYNHVEKITEQRFAAAFELAGADYMFEEGRSLLIGKVRLTLTIFGVIARGLSTTIWPLLTQEQRQASMAFSLELHPQQDEELWEDAVFAMPEFVRQGLLSGKPVYQWAEGHDAAIAWSFAEALCRSELARPVRAAAAQLPDDLASWLSGPVTKRTLVMPDSVEERVAEVNELMELAPSASAHALLGLAFHASSDDIERRVDQLERYYGSKKYSESMPLEASMQLAELLELFRDAREQLLNNPNRRRTAAHTAAQLTAPGSNQPEM